MRRRGVPRLLRRRHPRQPHARRLAGLLVAWLLVAATVVATWTPAHADDEQAGLDVQITDITPTVLRPGDDWVIRGTVTNTGTEELNAPVLRLRFQTYVPSTRSALAAWNVSGDSLVTTVLLAKQLDEDLRPGQRQSYEITLTPEESPFYSGAAWGPRGIAIEATSGDVQAVQRTTVLWYPEDQQVTAPTELSVLLPLTATAEEWATAAGEGTTLAEAAAGRLGTVLRSVDSPLVSWALDPALLEEQPLGAEAAAGAMASETEPGGPPSTEPGTSAPSTGEAGTDEGSTQQGTDRNGATGTATEAGTEPSTGTEETRTDDAPQGTATAPDPTQTTTDQGEGTDEEGVPSSTTSATSDLTGTELISALTTQAGRRDVIALAYADADPAALLSEQGARLAAAGRDRSSYLFGNHNIHPIDRVLWPSRYDLQSLGLVARSGVSSVVLPADSQPATGLSYTPSGRSRVSTGAGDLETALWDTGLSALFASDLTPLQIRQDLLAQTAIIARERPSDGRGLLAVAPQNVGTDPERLQAVTQALAAAGDAPWLQLTNLRSLLGRTDSGEQREALPAEPTTPPSLDRASVAQMIQVWSTLESFVAITDAPQRYLGTIGPNALATVSANLAGSPTQQLLADAATQATQQLSDSIAVESGSSVLLVSAGGDLPISIQSALPVPATVTVRLVPADPRLRAEEEVTATLRPHSTTTVRIPVTAVSNGNVEVHFEVLTPDATVQLASGEPFSVRVRADWESTGTIIVASLLVIGFVAGLVRTIRRGRPRTRAAAAAAAGQDIAVEEPSPPEHDDSTEQPRKEQR